MIHIYLQIKADKNELTEINIYNKTWKFEQFWHYIIVYVTVDKKALTIFELQAWGNKIWSNCVQVISIIRLHPSVYQKWNSKEWRFGIWQKICFQWSLLSNTLYWLFPDMRRNMMKYSNAIRLILISMVRRNFHDNFKYVFIEPGFFQMCIHNANGHLPKQRSIWFFTQIFNHLCESKSKSCCK